MSRHSSRSSGKSPKSSAYRVPSAAYGTKSPARRSSAARQLRSRAIRKSPARSTHQATSSASQRRSTGSASTAPLQPTTPTIRPRRPSSLGRSSTGAYMPPFNLNESPSSDPAIALEPLTTDDVGIEPAGIPLLETTRRRSVTCLRPEADAYEPRYYELSQGVPNRTPPYERGPLGVRNGSIHTPSNQPSTRSSSLDYRLTSSDEETPFSRLRITDRRSSLGGLGNPAIGSTGMLDLEPNAEDDVFGPDPDNSRPGTYVLSSPRRIGDYYGVTRREGPFLFPRDSLSGGLPRVSLPPGGPAPRSPPRRRRRVPTPYPQPRSTQWNSQRVEPNRSSPRRGQIGGRRPVQESERLRERQRSREPDGGRRRNTLASVIGANMGRVGKWWKDHVSQRKSRGGRSPMGSF